MQDDTRPNLSVEDIKEPKTVPTDSPDELSSKEDQVFSNASKLGKMTAAKREIHATQKIILDLENGKADLTSKLCGLQKELDELRPLHAVCKAALRTSTTNSVIGTLSMAAGGAGLGIASLPDSIWSGDKSPYCWAGVAFLIVGAITTMRNLDWLWNKY